MSSKWWIKFWITNIVTFIRVLGIFALIPVYKIYGGLATFLLSAVCFATDCVDGIMARGWNTSTFFGSFFDALSDKAFLIVNFLLLLTITPLAIIPIILEIGIGIVQSIKYYYKIKVLANLIGKFKMWVAGIAISLSYLIVDETFLNYFGEDFATSILGFNKLALFAIILTPLILCELATLISYIKEVFVGKKENTEELLEEKRKKDEQISKELQNKNYFDLLFDHDIYVKYKDYGSLKFVKSLAKKRNQS